LYNVTGLLLPTIFRKVLQVIKALHILLHICPNLSLKSLRNEPLETRTTNTHFVVAVPIIRHDLLSFHIFSAILLARIEIVRSCPLSCALLSIIIYIDRYLLGVVLMLF